MCSLLDRTLPTGHSHIVLGELAPSARSEAGWASQRWAVTGGALPLEYRMALVHVPKLSPAKCKAGNASRWLSVAGGALFVPPPHRGRCGRPCPDPPPGRLPGPRTRPGHCPCLGSSGLLRAGCVPRQHNAAGLLAARHAEGRLPADAALARLHEP